MTTDQRPRPAVEPVPGDVRSAMSGGGVWLDLGLLTVRVRSTVPELAAPLCSVYPGMVEIAPRDWADLHVELAEGAGPRRWLRRQSRFTCDGERPFEPFPADHALPLFEWGTNWVLARRMNDVLLLHAGVLERDGLALVMPALPGSGKSTLTAALSLRGWRLLSDEFGAFDPQTNQFRAVLKPVALKNRSIEVIRAFEPTAVLGPEFAKTRKGTVAHLAPSAAAVALRGVPASPGAVVFPRWQSGSATQWLPARPKVVFTTLAFNAFNYAAMGASGFQAVVRLTRRCPAWQLIYSDLDDALRTLERAWPEVRERALSESAP